MTGNKALGTMFGAAGVSTFMGIPACPDPEAVMGGIALIGADGCTPYASVGFYCAGGPGAIRAAGAAYAANLSHMNFDLGGPVFPSGVTAVDLGDLPVSEADGPGNRALLQGVVAKVLDRGAVPFLIGGDDSLPIPMLQAFAGRGRELTILQIDAHIDWRNEVQGERLGLSSTMRRASEMAHVGRIIQVGQRGIGSARTGDVADALAYGVRFVPAGEVSRGGIEAVVGLVPEGADVVICLDLDALDPAVMPAVIGRTAGGMSYWQVLDLIAGVAERARIAAFDMVEFMPERDIDGQGAAVAAQLLAAVMGIVARQGKG